MNTTNTNLTAETVTDDAISDLRSEAASAGDPDQIAICDRAIGSVDADDYSGLSPRLNREIRSMTKRDARKLCADAINAARAMDDSQAAAS